LKHVVILLVEDDPSDTFMVEEALKSSPIPVTLTVAEDGEIALSRLTKHTVKPDLIILDLSIPKVSGLSFLQKYRPRARPPIVVFSSTWDQSHIQRALSLGASEVIHKPMGLQAFTDAVCGMVRKWAPRAAA
jgi:DNA-binding response OmpR family regulator